MSVDSHAEFVKDVNRNRNWRVRNPWRAVRLAWGWTGVARLAMARAVGLLPLAALVFVAIDRGHPSLLFWSLPSPLAVWSANSGSAVPAIPWIAILPLGAIVAFVFGTEHLFGASVPGLIWMASTISRVVVMQAFLRRLRNSEESWRRIVRENMLDLTDA